MLMLMNEQMFINIFSMFTNVLQILIIVDTANIFVKYSKYFSNVYKYFLFIRLLFTNIVPNVYKYIV